MFFFSIADIIVRQSAILLSLFVASQAVSGKAEVTALPRRCQCKQKQKAVRSKNHEQSIKFQHGLRDIIELRKKFLGT